MSARDFGSRGTEERGTSVRELVMQAYGTDAEKKACKIRQSSGEVMGVC